MGVLWCEKLNGGGANSWLQKEARPNFQTLPLHFHVNSFESAPVRVTGISGVQFLQVSSLVALAVTLIEGFRIL